MHRSENTLPLQLLRFFDFALHSTVNVVGQSSTVFVHSAPASALQFAFQRAFYRHPPLSVPQDVYHESHDHIEESYNKYSFRFTHVKKLQLSSEWRRAVFSISRPWRLRKLPCDFSNASSIDFSYLLNSTNNPRESLFILRSSILASRSFFALSSLLPDYSLQVWTFEYILCTYCGYYLFDSINMVDCLARSLRKRERHRLDRYRNNFHSCLNKQSYLSNWEISFANDLRLNSFVVSNKCGFCAFRLQLYFFSNVCSIHSIFLFNSSLQPSGQVTINSLRTSFSFTVLETSMKSSFSFRIRSSISSFNPFFFCSVPIGRRTALHPTRNDCMGMVL